MKPKTTVRIKRIFLCLLLIVAAQVHSTAQVVTSNNTALNKTATASSFESLGSTAANAFDGDLHTFFSSAYTDNEWLSVDLGRSYAISQVVLKWEKAYGKDFDIQFSMNGTYTDMTGSGIQVRNNVFTGDSTGISTLATKPNTIARYVKMQGLHRATSDGYALKEFLVTGAISVAAQLPVTLTGFTAAQQTSSSLLEWSTTTEYNNAGFYVERSNDGVSFVTIGWVVAKNGGTVISHYAFTDKQMLVTKNYYRLKITDLNGKTVYSPAIIIGTASQTAVSAYPIPVKDHFTIEYKGSTGENINVSLVNTGGQPVYSNNYLVNGTRQTMVINRTGNMLPGVYFLAIHSNQNGEYTRQIVLE